PLVHRADGNARTDVHHRDAAADLLHGAADAIADTGTDAHHRYVAADLLHRGANSDAHAIADAPGDPVVHPSDGRPHADPDRAADLPNDRAAAELQHLP